jgi:dTDP-4-dehydrorhamnose 3,5-epimerase
VEFRELNISGAWEITPLLQGDPRGLFLEWYKAPAFTDVVGHALDLQQVNCSVSAAGVVRGIHFADVPPGQAKYVTCPSGAVLDVVVDLRVGSPTFGRWDSVLLDDVDRRAVYLSEGLGHAFVSLEDGSTVLYLCSTGYSPGREHGVHPLDASVSIEWPSVDRHGAPLRLQFSAKDEAAPTLAAAAAAGLLPQLDVVERYIHSSSR